MTPSLLSNLHIEAEQQHTRLHLICRGHWTWDHVTDITRSLARCSAVGINRLTLNLSKVESLDSVGAHMMHRFASSFEVQGVEIFWQPGRFHDLVELARPPTLEAEEDADISPGFLEQFGASVSQRGQRLIGMIAFLGHVLFTAARVAIRPHRFRFVSIVNHIERAGLEALPLIGLLAFVFGVILAFQGSFQLARFGAESLAIKMVAIAALREFGVMTTTILVAGRSGSAFCAELGLMAVNQEVDAMRAMSLDPMERLVLPRLIALVVIMPLLTTFADIMVLAGGAYHALTSLDLTLAQYIDQAGHSLSWRHYWVGLVKAPFFGAIIALVSCYIGLSTRGGADAVGMSTNRSVVLSLFLTIIADGLFSVFFTLLRI